MKISDNIMMRIIHALLSVLIGATLGSVVAGTWIACNGKLYNFKYEYTFQVIIIALMFSIIVGGVQGFISCYILTPYLRYKRCEKILYPLFFSLLSLITVFPFWGWIVNKGFTKPEHAIFSIIIPIMYGAFVGLTAGMLEKRFFKE